jgi:hypothetical protein
MQTAHLLWEGTTCPTAEIGCARRTEFPEWGGPADPHHRPRVDTQGKLTGRSLFVLPNFLSNRPKLMELVSPPSSYCVLQC